MGRLICFSYKVNHTITRLPSRWAKQEMCMLTLARLLFRGPLSYQGLAISINNRYTSSNNELSIASCYQWCRARLVLFASYNCLPALCAKGGIDNEIYDDLHHAQGLHGAVVKLYFNSLHVELYVESFHVPFYYCK